MRAKSVATASLLAVIALVIVAVNLDVMINWRLARRGTKTSPGDVGVSTTEVPMDGVGLGKSNKQAIAVIFADLKDVLVLERAEAIWNSLVGARVSTSDIFAIVPQVAGMGLETPLRSMGYRVLVRESVSPLWRVNGPRIQHALAGGGGIGVWSLEALRLEDYAQVIVLDQKMIVLPEGFLDSPLSPRREPEQFGADPSRSPSVAHVVDAANPDVRADKAGNLTQRNPPGGVRQRHEKRQLRPDLRAPIKVPRVQRSSRAFVAGEADGTERQEAMQTRRLSWSSSPRPHLSSRSRRRPHGRGQSEVSPLRDDGAGRRHRRRMRFEKRWTADRILTGDDLRVEEAGLTDFSETVFKAGSGDGWGLNPLTHGRRMEEIARDQAPGSLKYRLPKGSDVAFLPGDGVSLAHGKCDTFMDNELKAVLLGQHAGLMVVRPNREFYHSLEELLSEEAKVFEVAYREAAERDRQIKGARINPVTGELRPTLVDRLAPSAPLLQLALALHDGVKADILPFELCDQGPNWIPRIMYRALVWCGIKDRDGRSPADGVSNGSPGVRAGGQEGAGEGDSGEPSGEAGAMNREEAKGNSDGGALENLQGGSDGGTRNGTRSLSAAEGQGTLSEAGLDGSAALAWIPHDPCSCQDAPGRLGESCRWWLRFARGSEDEAELAGLCRDGVFQSPRPIPPPSEPHHLRAMKILEARATIPATPGGGAGGGGERVVPPPIWQERPKKKAKITKQDLASFRHFWLINEKAKLLMVAIPKVACTQVHALFLRLQNSADWNTQVLWRIHMNKEQHLYTMMKMEGMTPERATEIFNDPTWTRGVFLRDPAERLLSCYLDKIVNRRSYSINIFQSNDFLSFEKFVALLGPDAKERFRGQYRAVQLGLSRFSNPHWMPQLYFGLDKFLPYFDFIGDFRYAQEHSEELLRRAGLWDDYGASGWGPDGTAAFFQRPTVKGHSTSSSKAMSSYYTVPLVQAIRRAYNGTDYKMFSKLGWWDESKLVS